MHSLSLVNTLSDNAVFCPVINCVCVLRLHVRVPFFGVIRFFGGIWIMHQMRYVQWNGDWRWIRDHIPHRCSHICSNKRCVAAIFVRAYLLFLLIVFACLSVSSCINVFLLLCACERSWTAVSLYIFVISSLLILLLCMLLLANASHRLDQRGSWYFLILRVSCFPYRIKSGSYTLIVIERALILCLFACVESITKYSFSLSLHVNHKMCYNVLLFLLLLHFLGCVEVRIQLLKSESGSGGWPGLRCSFSCGHRTGRSQPYNPIRLLVLSLHHQVCALF